MKSRIKCGGWKRDGMFSKCDLASCSGTGSRAAEIPHHFYELQGIVAFVCLHPGFFIGACQALSLATERLEASSCGEVLFSLPVATPAAMALSAPLSWIPASSGGSVGDFSTSHSHLVSRLTVNPQPCRHCFQAPPARGGSRGATVCLCVFTTWARQALARHR